MGRALVATTVSKANTAGGTFADTLTAVSGDSATVVNYDGPADQAGAKILEMWAIDSDSVAELAVTYTRQQSVNDQTRGVRFNIPSLIPGGAAVVGAHNLLAGYGTIPLFKSDTGTFTVTSTAADDVVCSFNALYDNMPGVSAVLASWDQVQALRYTTLGLQCNPVASATEGSLGAARAMNADDTRMIANTWYAILGITMQTVATTIYLQGPDWGGQRIAIPGGVAALDSPTFFIEQTLKWGVPLIPCVNSNNAGSTNLFCINDEASTSPKVDLLMYGLTGKPGY